MKKKSTDLGKMSFAFFHCSYSKVGNVVNAACTLCFFFHSSQSSYSYRQRSECKIFTTSSLPLPARKTPRGRKTSDFPRQAVTSSIFPAPRLPASLIVLLSSPPVQNQYKFKLFRIIPAINLKFQSECLRNPTSFRTNFLKFLSPLSISNAITVVATVFTFGI